MAINSEKISAVATAINNRITNLISSHNSSASAHNQGNANGNKNVVTDASGNITTEAKPTIPSASSTTPSADTTAGSVGTSTTWARADHKHPLSSEYATASHTHSDYNKATYSQTIASTATGAYKIGTITVDGTATDIYGKDTNTEYSHPSTHAATMITDANAHTNIGSSAGATQGAINTAIDTALSNLSTSLSNVELITVVDSLGTASASTMNKMYLVAESSSKTNDAYEIYITVRTGTSSNYSYAWEKVDTARIDLSGYSTTSHTHGNITADGKVGSNANYFVYTTTNGAVTSKQKIGNITTDGAIGTTSGIPIITGTSGVLQASSFGTTSGTFAEGNHTHSSYTTTSDVDSEINTALDELAEAIYPSS